MLIFDKTEIRESLTIENIFDLLNEWGGDPEYTSFGILSTTICHNKPGEGSKKLYYYSNSDLFRCYTGCDSSFDIFELTIKVAEIQGGKKFDLNDAVRFIAFKLGIAGREDYKVETDIPEDWKFLAAYDKINNLEIKTDYSILLKTYDDSILDKLNYSVKLSPWLNEGIADWVLKDARIGFFPGADQITIPHYDMNGRFIGLRGRTMCVEEGEKYGKYRPVVINKNLYNHPLGMNLYNLNLSKENIKIAKTAIIFESEKSCLKYRTYFGRENDISVACCGSNVTLQQMYLLLQLGVNEVIIAFDRQFQEIGDKEFKHLTKNLTKIHNKFKNDVIVSFIFDKKKITGYKDAPIDDGREIFIQLLQERIYL